MLFNFDDVILTILSSQESQITSKFHNKINSKIKKKIQTLNSRKAYQNQTRVSKSRKNDWEVEGFCFWNLCRYMNISQL